MMFINKLFITIPVFNQATTIHRILNKIKDVHLENQIQKEILIINDCSTDDTKEVIQSYILQNNKSNILYFEHPKNKGKRASFTRFKPFSEALT